jgi:hypothetical protein
MMNGYAVILFFHIVGALGFFVALGLEWTTIRQLRRVATVEQLREWLRLSNGASRVGMVSMLVLLGTGFHMMAKVWGGVAWILVALGTIVLLAVLTVALSRRRMAAIGKEIASEKGPLSPALQQLLHHPMLWIAIQTRVGIALGIIYLMTVKPDLIGALLTVGVATLLGLAAAIPLSGRARRQEEVTV